MDKREKTCFVIMPFGDKESPLYRQNLNIYRKLIKPVVEERCGYRAIRADELDHVGNITKDIIEHLHEADLVIADMTGRNANVFYELGVRHTLQKCGTIPIIQKDESIPFDVNTYRAVLYSTKFDQVEEFSDELERRIKAAEQRRDKKSDNPVHDFLGDDIFKSDADVESLTQELQSLRQEKLRLEKLNKQHAASLKDQEKAISAAKTQSDKKEAVIEELKQKIVMLEQKLSNKQKPNGRKKQTKGVNIGRRPPKTLGENDVVSLLQQFNLFDKRKNPNGKGITHDYREQSVGGDLVISDHAVSLMWQKSGSGSYMDFHEAQKWINDLNEKRFAGCKDWRLPTLEEAMSLMEHTKKNGNLYIDPIFDKTQRRIWTCDKVTRASRAWVVGFDGGGCDLGYYIDDLSYWVRAVRS